VYLAVVKEFLMPISEEQHFNSVLQRDGATPRFDVAVREGPLEPKVSVKMGWQRWPSHWPCFSPDTTFLDVFFCVYVEDAIYGTPLPATLVELELLQLQIHHTCHAY
jgi:hypothetical protein